MNPGKKIFGTLIIPSIASLVAAILCAFGHVTLFDSAATWLVFVRSIVSVSIVTFALSINLGTGRFDFSIGSVSLLTSTIVLKLALSLNLSPILTILFSVVIGAILGFLSGGVYVITKLPAIIVSLGVTLFYEGLAYTITGGHGVSIVINEGLMNFKTIPNFVTIGIIVLIFIVIVFDHTVFGYDYKALITGQTIAVNIGINENLNALICYAISGGLMGIYGFISATTNGVVSMSLNFGSISPMFIAFLPMFIGGFIGKYSNDKLGYVIGGFVSALISVIFIRFNVDSSVQQIITAVILVLFLIYLNNQGLLKKIVDSLKRNKLGQVQA